MPVIASQSVREMGAWIKPVKPHEVLSWSPKIAQTKKPLSNQTCLEHLR